MRDLERDRPRGLNVRALLSVAYDTGLRASELVAVCVGHLVEALNPEARLLEIPRSKADQEGEGATAFLSPRSVRAIAAWCEAARITDGPLFRRVQVRRFKARPAIEGRPIGSIGGREAWDLRKTLPKPAVPALVDYDVGELALHPGSIGPIYRAIIQRAFDRGALPDLNNHSQGLLKPWKELSMRVCPFRYSKADRYACDQKIPWATQPPDCIGIFIMLAIPSAGGHHIENGSCSPRAERIFLEYRNLRGPFALAERLIRMTSSPGIDLRR